MTRSLGDFTGGGGVQGTKGLYSFQPAKGKYGGSGTYYFPPVKDQDQRTMNINKGGNAYVELEETRGIYPSSGDLPMFESNAEWDLTFNFIPPYLQIAYAGYTNLLSNGSALLDLALLDFTQYVVEGGRGIISEYYWAVDSNYNPTLSLRTTDAYIDGTIAHTRTAGGTVLEVTVKFNIPSGTWTMADGTIVDFH